MYRNLLLLIFLCCLTTYSFALKIKYDQYKVFTLAIENINQANVLQFAASNPNSEYDFWKSPILGQNAEIMVPPHKIADFNELVQSINISCLLKIENVQRYKHLKKIIQITCYGKFQFDRSRKSCQLSRIIIMECIL